MMSDCRLQTDGVFDGFQTDGVFDGFQTDGVFDGFQTDGVFDGFVFVSDLFNGQLGQLTSYHDNHSKSPAMPVIKCD